MPDALALMTATEMISRFRAGNLSPVEVTKAALDAIARRDPDLNAFVLVDEEAALAAAAKSEERWRLEAPKGRLDGVPTSIKDIILTKGWPTLRGSKTVDRNQAWTEDAPCTARLREHGAILLGKTTTPEFGWKGVTDSPGFGTTRNPWNPELTPGGSSGGSAVAVACGMGALAIGTDGGGSIRIPAGFTGVFGMKATFGRVPAYPLSPFGTVAHVGPMTRSVADAALMLTVISEPDPRDWYALPNFGTDFTHGLDDGVSGLRIAFSETLGGKRVDPEVARIVRAAAHSFEELGAVVEQAEPDLSGAGEIFLVLWFAGAANLLESIPEEKRSGMDAGFREIAEAGSRYSLRDYLQAVAKRERLGTAMNLFHQDYDLLLTPTLPIPAFAAGHEHPPSDDGTRWSDWTPFTYPFNLTQQPAASVPCGFTAAGLPVGLQIVGQRYDDSLVLRAARAYESLHPIAPPPG